MSDKHRRDVDLARIARDAGTPQAVKPLGRDELVGDSTMGGGVNTGSQQQDLDAATGSWTRLYTYGLEAPADTQLGMAIVAVKLELVFNGFGDGITKEPLFGNFARDRTVEFQREHSLDPDGVIGPLTARVLFRKRVSAVESLHKIPNHLLARLKTWESRDDPNAVGALTPGDHGLVQISLPNHPNVSMANAVDPGWCLSWGAAILEDVHGVMLDWDATLVSWNQGSYYAGKWLKAGKPKSGGPTYVINGVVYDRWVQAWKYRDGVMAQPL